MPDVPRRVRRQRRCQWRDVDDGEVDDGGVSNGDVSDWDISDGDVVDGAVGNAGRWVCGSDTGMVAKPEENDCITRLSKGEAGPVQLWISLTWWVMTGHMFWLISSERSVSSWGTLQWLVGETGPLHAYTYHTPVTQLDHNTMLAFYKGTITTDL